MSYPGSHQKGPIVSDQGFKVGTKDSNTNVVDSSGYLYNAGTKLSDVGVFSETIVFDSIGAAGTYTGDITLPAGHMIENIIVHNVTACNAGTSAVLEVGDYSDATTAIDADGFFNDIDVKTALAAGESVDFYRTAAKQGAYLPYTTDGQNAASKVNKRYSATARIIRGKITTVGTASTTGKQLMTVIYTVPSPTSATFVAT
jgi:hypothetical protein